MLVFWKEKLVLLAVPKTGTTALEGALAPRASLVLRDPPILKHCPAYRYRRFLEPFFAQAGQETLETLAVIRHPVDWLSSWYRYRHRDDLQGHPNSTRGMSFDTFVMEYTKGKPAPFAAVGSQAKFVQGQDGVTVVTHVYRYEAQDKLIDFLQDRLSVRINLPRLNVSPQMELALSPEVRDRLEQKCPSEFAVWDSARH